MYRDLVGDPERITVNGREWWLQQFCRWDGTLKAVRLYDDNGEFVAEFPGVEEAFRAAAGAHESADG